MKQSENQMGTKAIFPLLMGMSVPPMISMLIQSLYNIVDSIFVAKLGEEALTAVSLAYPLQNLVLAVAVGPVSYTHLQFPRESKKRVTILSEIWLLRERHRDSLQI